ncbi:MAG: hypothetical protein PSU83_10320 [Flavobacterium sp.]|nr:hypothetical protein [Flavobacterium sp.]MDI1317688.1 hypothetical protein [Flavobacterium sp.]
MSNKEKLLSKKKQEKILIKLHNIAEKCKSSCCEKYKKKESKRCKRCPMFDLLKKYKTPS